ncbi:MAG: MBOAT family protein [Proteobacteria bacterium]|nr:MAG: MBOAT family protein [Pseudomonadota bacterium]
MSFASSHFFIFLFTVITLYWLAPKKFDRRLLILAASWCFYASGNVNYLALLITVTALDFFLARLIRWTQNNSQRHLSFGLLTLSVGVNLLILIYFKAKLIASENETNMFIPIGISFYTFQSISYVVDVYRRRFEPEQSFLNYALYISFFPQLVAGPIERARKLIPQLEMNWRQRIPTPLMLQQAAWLIYWGIFKKVAISDQLAPYASWSVTGMGAVSGVDVWLSSVVFILQFFCDFSAYTDIARGTALLFGIRLSENFRYPYFATSPREFWQRWHITLGSWFRDYVYAPLVKLNVARPLVTIITMTLVGIWHGFEWKFAIWGLFWGVLIVADEAFRKLRTALAIISYPRLRSFTGWIIVMLAWVLSGFFFVAKDVEGALILLKRSMIWGVSSRSVPDALSAFTFLVPFIVIETLQWRANDKFFWFNWKWPARSLFLIALVIYYLGNYAIQTNDFIYFAF